MTGPELLRADSLMAAFSRAGAAVASIECGLVLSGEKETAGTWLEDRCGVALHRLGLPIGIRQSDRFFDALSVISGRPIPEKYTAQRGRLLDAMVDGHKHFNGVHVALFGEEDLVAGLAAFCGELGIIPALCATGGGRGRFGDTVRAVVPERFHDRIRILEDADFVTIEKTLEGMRIDLLIGHSKGYTMSRRLKRPLIRVGFPVHDRVDGSRLLHLGYRGAQQLFDRIANTLIEEKQEKDHVGYTYY